MSDLIVCPRCKCSHGLQFVKIRPGVVRGFCLRFCGYEWEVITL